MSEVRNDFPKIYYLLHLLKQTNKKTPDSVTII